MLEPGAAGRLQRGLQERLDAGLVATKPQSLFGPSAGATGRIDMLHSGLAEAT